MGRNKDLRKRIRGQHRVIEKHVVKIENELEKDAPDMGLIRKWEREIDIAREAVRKLEQRLEK